MFKFKSYDIIKRAIIEGTNYGYSRAHKHTDSPSEDDIKGEIVQGIMLELSEVIIFEELGDGRI